MSAAKVYSYLRFSDAKQATGGSIERQTDYARRWATEHGMQLDDALTMRDEGLSAYHQKHIKHGALGVFLAAVDGGCVPSGALLIVEGLDRLSRAEPILAQAQLAQIVNAGITVVTASDGKQYNRDPLDAALGFRPAVVHGIDDDATPGGRYPHFAESLRKIAAGDLCRR